MLAQQRETVRCGGCSLVQFMTVSALCRRCHKSIAPIPEPEPEPVLAPRLVVPREDFSHIGETVRALRIERKLHQRQLAHRMGVPRSYVSKTELGRLTPTISSLSRLAKALRVDIATLLGETVTRDPFIAEIAPYLAQLDEYQRTVILNTVREAATRGIA